MCLPIATTLREPLVPVGSVGDPRLPSRGRSPKAAGNHTRLPLVGLGHPLECLSYCALTVIRALELVSVEIGAAPYSLYLFSVPGVEGELLDQGKIRLRLARVRGRVALQKLAPFVGALRPEHFHYLSIWIRISNY
jgi:hypothetical protein